jgi:DNA polymerase-3 subunit alpha
VGYNAGVAIMDSFSDQFSKLSFPDLGLVRFPDVAISDEDKALVGLRARASNIEFLKYLTWEGVQRRRAEGKLEGFTDAQIVETLKMEFATFEKTGVHDYLLMIWDINRWADKQGIIRGWGRGSAASSFTLFALRITNVNPLRHRLNFPRFLSEARMKPVIKDGVIYVDGKSAPDVDCDYQYGRRPEVVHYVEQKYAGRTSKISTRLELTGKMALKDAVKTYLEYGEEEAKRVSDMIEARFGKVQSLSEAKEKNDDVKAWLAQSERNREVYALAMAIEGLAVGKGQHPSGVFVCYHPLDGNIPVELAKNGDVVTTYDMETVAGLGIKADILGVRTLDLVADTAVMAGEDIDAIDVNSSVIYEYLGRAQNAYMGLFQIEEGTTKEATVKVGPQNIDDLSAVLAVSRPGALKHLDQYANYVRNGELKTIYPAVDEVLKSTGNVLVFQEQITRVCMTVFGMDPISADSVRYAVGKKKKEEMAKWEQVLRDNGKARGVPPNVVQYFWDVCNASADYLFVHCLSPDTIVDTPQGPRCMYEIVPGDMVKAYDVAADKEHYVKVTQVIPNEVEVYEVELEDGRKITASLDHRFMCEDKQMHPLKDVILKGLRVLTD